MQNNNSKKKPALPLKQDLANGHSFSSSGISESDDTNRKYHAKEEPKKRHKSLASDADCETDDSGEHKRRKGSSSTNSLTRKNKKPKDSKASLKQNDDSCPAYGGTNTVELNCADTLASYCPKGIKSPRKAGAANSTNPEKKYQEMSFTNSYAKKNSKAHYNKSYEAENGKPSSYHHKHSDDSSNSDFVHDCKLNFAFDIFKFCGIILCSRVTSERHWNQAIE